jgi:copper chaperone
MAEIVFTVAGMSCSHCQAAVGSELEAVPGVLEVEVDLETRLVVVRGDGLDDAVLRAAIEAAGYEAA